LSVIAAQLAAVSERSLPAGRESRLGVAVVGLAQELGAARCELAALKRENAALRSGLDAGGSA
jgi:hypothetical protein